jgi:hypothetical protein
VYPAFRTRPNSVESKPPPTHATECSRVPPAAAVPVTPPRRPRRSAADLQVLDLERWEFVGRIEAEETPEEG